MTVVIVEDDAVVADTLKAYLEQAGYTVAAARDGVRGLELARAPSTSLVILDLMVPGVSGQEICRRLRAESPVPILMLTARTSEEDRIAGLQAGADDYVGKPFSPREIVARAQALLRRAGGASSRPQPPLRIGDLDVDVWGRQARVRGRAVALTATEFRLLEALAAGPGRTFTRDELLSRAFGPDFEGTERTIDVHITNLRRKLDATHRDRYVQTVHGVGYRLVTSDDP